MSSRRDDAEGFPSEWYGIAEEAHFWFAWRYQVLRYLILKAGVPFGKNLRGLDIGCGMGVVQKQLENDSDWIVDGVELNTNALQNHVKTRGRCWAYDIADKSPDLDASYDFVVIFDVLEHLSDPQYFIENASYHLKDGGFVFFNVPAMPSLFSSYDKAVGHLRRYDYKMLHGLFAGAPVELMCMNYWGAAMLPMLLARRLVVGNKASGCDTIRTGMKVKYQWFNLLLTKIMKCEMACRPCGSVGTSIMGICRKRH